MQQDDGENRANAPLTPRNQHQPPSVRSQQSSTISAVSTVDDGPEDRSFERPSQDDGDIGASLGSGRGLGLQGDNLHHRTNTRPTIIHVKDHTRPERQNEPSSAHQSFGSRSDATFPQSASSTARLLGEFPPLPTNGNNGDPGKSPKVTFVSDDDKPPSESQIYDSRSSKVYLGLIILSFFSTSISLVFFIIAAKKHQYKSYVADSGGHITPSNIATVYALFAKLIEMSFVAIFVAFVGQVVSRRSFVRAKSGGMTMADMSMRLWLLQPGTMFTRYGGLRYGAITRLGGLTLLATLSAMLYTTASQILVNPHLDFTGFESVHMRGQVKTNFGNVTYANQNCRTPITTSQDPVYWNSTCMTIENAAQTYHNYQFYLKNWEAFSRGKGSSDLKSRPEGIASLRGNIDVRASWIDIADMRADSARWDRTVVNVTLAFPHTGIIEASRDPMNRLPQPEPLSGFGAYDVHAAVASPMVHVLCANMSKNELRPMLRDATNRTVIPTVVDDLFRLGSKYDRPIPLWNHTEGPDVYGSILNDTGVYGEHDAIYLLSKGADGLDSQPIYSMCSIRAGLTDRCSTRYHASGSGSLLESHCEDPKDDYRFSKHRQTQDSLYIQETIDDWVENAFSWITSVNLGGGTEGLRNSNERLLSQLIPKTDHLDPKLPSIAEALAEMAGTSLLNSAQDAPLVNFTARGIGNYSLYQTYNAQVNSQQYVSGPTGKLKVQHLLYIPLFLVCAGNFFIFFWLLVHSGMVTDLTDPLNLFTVTVISPPSHMFTRRSGDGPEGKQYKTPWFVNLDRDRLIIENGDERLDNTKYSARERSVSSATYPDSPMAKKYWDLSKRRKSFL
ncbi:MAG: hypothetical protein M1831_001464 [Alyxoria varia]|nr:MAG: hypothetical protein M1831_001464 [Alyxoria varia]